MYRLPTIDMSTKTSGVPFDTPLGTNVGTAAILLNESPFLLEVDTSGGFAGQGPRIPAYCMDIVPLDRQVTTLTIRPISYLTIAGGAPAQLLSILIVQPGEEITGTFPAALPRLTTIGNQVTTTQVTSLANDGNAPATSIIESTPSDQPGNSAFALFNDGSGAWKVLSAGVQRIVAQVTRGNASSTKSVAVFGAPSDLTITGFYGVFKGTFDPSVLFPGSQVSGDVAANQIGPGALDADVTIAGSSVTGDLAANQIGPGALDTDVTIVGSQVASGTVPDATTADTADQVAYNGASTTFPQLLTGTAAAGLAAKDNKAAGYVELFPTMNDATARGVQLDYQDAAGALHAGVLIDGSGNTVVPGVLKNAGGQVFHVSSFFNGSGAGTFSHGLGATPSWVGVTEDVANNTMTVGVDTIGATTVHIDVGAAGQAWIAVATD